MDEMRNIGPIMAIDAVEPQSRAEALALHVEPNLAQAVGRQLGLAPLVMYLLLEGDKRDLADDRVEHVLDFAGEHDLAPAGVGFAREQRPERQHLAKDRSGLGESKRRVGHQVALDAGQKLMHAMAGL